MRCLELKSHFMFVWQSASSGANRLFYLLLNLSRNSFLLLYIANLETFLVQER